jgi:glyoxylase-like metal-dependent hydrolase (beta-lactamase superfamily II)
MRCLALASLASLAAACAHPQPLTPRSAAAPEIRQLDVGGGANVFVVMGARPILVDTGWGAKSDLVLRALARISVQPRDLALIVLTHGHGDHAGGAARLRALSGAKVLIERDDVPMLAAGHNRPLRATGWLGRRLRGFSDKPFPPFAPDIVIDGEFDLRPYGVAGKVVPMPGHTPGSSVVLLPAGDVIVGDMLRGELLRPHAPARHFFHDDCRAAEAHLAPLVQAGARRLFVGHGGPIDAADAAARLAATPCAPAS